jgi:uncharacterized protein YprB with RNaseH-like and TPR domain
LSALGLTTRQSALAASDKALCLEAGLSPSDVLKIRLHQLATESHSLIHFATSYPPLPEERVIFDVETGIADRDPWLIGIQLPGQAEVRQWIVPQQHARDRLAMYEAIFETLTLYPDAPMVAWGGNSFDDSAIRRGLSLWAPHLLSQWAHRKVIDLTCQLRNTLALPVGVEWRLDSFAKYVAAPVDWGNDRLTGLEIGIFYDRFLRDGRPLPLDRICDKNRIDVEALDYISTLTSTASFRAIDLAGRADLIERLAPAISMLKSSSSLKYLKALVVRASKN